MPIWKLKPKAAPDDPRWLDHAIWEEVVVRAPTSGMARLIASELERDPQQPPSGNENPSFQSGFEDEKLYDVLAVSSPEGKGLPEPPALAGKSRVLRAVRARSGEPSEPHP